MKDIIYNQHEIPRHKLRYGLRSSAATGCGWIAVYNALRLMGYRVQPEKLVRYFTWQLPLINGNMGTFLFGPAWFFRQKGFTVRMVFRRSRFDQAAREADACVLFYYWRRKWRMGAHFVAVQYQNGRFVGCNTYRNSQGPDVYGESLARFIKERNYFCPVLMAVNIR